jgi:hypothetical protein
MGEFAMTAIAFDTLKFANRLKTAGVPSAQAEAEAEALADVFEVGAQELATKTDIRQLEERTDAKFDLLRKDLAALEVGLRSDLDRRFAGVDNRFASVDTRFAKMEGEMSLLKWMLGVVIAGILSLVLKGFF